MPAKSRTNPPGADVQPQFRIVERAATRLKLRQLRLLVAVDEQSSILHAAKVLNISQPAASKLIQDLEEDFGVQLFDRTNRGVVPTGYGEVLIRHGRLILAQLQHAAQELDDIHEGSSGRVVVGTLLTASALLLPRTIANVSEQKPKLSIKLVEGTHDLVMPALRAGDIDMVVGHLPAYRYRNELRQEKLYDEYVVAVTRTGHPLQKKKRVTFNDLMRFGWILPPPETTLRRQIDRLFLDRDRGLPEHFVESVSYLSNRELLASSNMIGLFPRHVVERDVAVKVLKLLGWKPPIQLSPVGLSYRKDKRLSPASELFLNELRKVAARL